MLTARCNLSCSYCVLENNAHQLMQEISLSKKIDLISHLYNKLGFRSLTLSGGEPLLIGNKSPSDFLFLLDYLKQFKSDKIEDNLQLQLYTNGLLLSDNVANAMIGIIDEVSITIDSVNHDVLTMIGKKCGVTGGYLTMAITLCKRLAERKIGIKLHTVISSLNVNRISNDVMLIYEKFKNANVKINKWKFFQYMSYDVPSVDKKHCIAMAQFMEKKKEITNNLRNCGIGLHFKDNDEMNESIFNILPYGNAQYIVSGDTWTTSKRTDNLLNYSTMTDLFQRTNISKRLFEKHHSFFI